MPLNTLAVKTVPTSYTVTGGTSLPLIPLRDDHDRVVLRPTSDTVLATRRTLDVQFVESKANIGSLGGFTQARCKTFLKLPKTRSDGKVTMNTVNLQLACDTETTDAEKTAQLDWIAQVVTDPAFRAAYLKGSGA